MSAAWIQNLKTSRSTNIPLLALLHVFEQFYPIIFGNFQTYPSGSESNSSGSKEDCNGKHGKNWSLNNFYNWNECLLCNEND